ncbi:sensor histidine kinase [Desulforhopalus sp. 52FAK]
MASQGSLSSTTDNQTWWDTVHRSATHNSQEPMPKQLSGMNTLWLIHCIRTYHPEVDLQNIVRETRDMGPFYIKNLRTGHCELVELTHLETRDYWFSNMFMMALYTTIEQYIDDPGFAYKCGSTFYKTQSSLKIALGVPLIGPYRLIKRLVSENDKYNRTKEALLLSITRGHAVVRLIHKPDIIMKDFGMMWHLGVFESYARLSGVTDIEGKVICVQEGPQRYGESGQAIYDFEFTFKDPGFIPRIWNRILYSIPAVQQLIEGAEQIEIEHTQQILDRDAIIAEKTNHLVNIQKNLMDAERMNIEKKLETLSAELISTEERERKAIAEDLHDSVTQLLALSISNLKSFNCTNPGHDALGNVQEYLETALADTRSLTFQISPPVLYDFGLEAALAWLVEDISGRYPIEMDCINLIDHPLQLNDYQKVTLYRAARETVINCIKHSKANYASVVVLKEEGVAKIEVEDNGIGFNPLNLKKGFGLSALGDRLESIGAGIEIISTPGKGSRITFSIPQEDGE